jgi:phosphoglycerol transferase
MLGTTITQLVLPATSHRVDFLANLKVEFIQGATLLNGNHPYINENDWASLGLIGSLGFLFLLVWLIFARRRYGDADSRFFPMITSLAVLNIAAVLLATIGGFGLLFSIIISPQIRAYNRISIYIGFFSILVVLLLVERLREKYAKTGARAAIFIGIMMVVVAIGIVDQTNDGMVPDYKTTAKAYGSDQAFVQQIEAGMPAQAMVFQLPYVPFPENPEVNAMPDYHQLRAYLHSRTIRWSYGTMKGRNGDLWQRSVASEPTSQFLKDIVAAGFNGIWVNRAGYADGAAQIERQLKDELEVKPMVNDDNTLLFFDLKGYIDRQP